MITALPISSYRPCGLWETTSSQCLCTTQMEWRFELVSCNVFIWLLISLMITDVHGWYQELDPHDQLNGGASFKICTLWRYHQESQHPQLLNGRCALSLDVYCIHSDIVIGIKQQEVKRIAPVIYAVTNRPNKHGEHARAYACWYLINGKDWTWWMSFST